MDLILSLLISEENDYKKDYLIEDYFKLPIEMIEDKIELRDNIKNDLELKEFKYELEESNILDLSNNKYKDNLYDCIFKPRNKIEKCLTSRWCNYYTNNREFLNDSQDLLRKFKNSVYFKDRKELYEEVYSSCEDIVKDNGFREKYQYIDLPYLNKYNNNEMCMQMLSIFNLANPVMSLLAPILLLLLPFFIIKLQGHNITLESYLNHLKEVFSNHIIGQFFNDFYDSPLSSKIYLLASIFFYIFQTYNNIISCGKFYKNIKFIHDKLIIVKEYINESINNMRNLLKYTECLSTYSDFNNKLNENINTLNNYLNMLNNIEDYSISLRKLFSLGHMMRCFYKLHNDENIKESLYYSFGCNGYIENILNIQKHIKNNNMNICNFIDNSSNSIKTNLKNSYYGKLLLDSSNNIVKNSYKLDNNLILTGPNAAGKTTLLKSTLFNIILCQQIGCGFFDKADVIIYDYIHCYINIPDTSGRDSLFQAEARRCKEIISIIEENKDKNHLCVFDELYSGTNPEEATCSAIALLNYLNKISNVNYILTTHYYKLCKKVDKYRVKNYHMEINKEMNNFKFSYKIKKGISKVKGGIKVLKDLEYPEEIIKNIR